METRGPLVPNKRLPSWGEFKFRKGASELPMDVVAVIVNKLGTGLFPGSMTRFLRGVFGKGSSYVPDLDNRIEAAVDQMEEHVEGSWEQPGEFFPHEFDEWDAYTYIGNVMGQRRKLRLGVSAIVYPSMMLDDGRLDTGKVIGDIELNDPLASPGDNKFLGFVWNSIDGMGPARATFFQSVSGGMDPSRMRMLLPIGRLMPDKYSMEGVYARVEDQFWSSPASYSGLDLDTACTFLALVRFVRRVGTAPEPGDLEGTDDWLQVWNKDNLNAIYRVLDAYLTGIVRNWNAFVPSALPPFAVVVNFTDQGSAHDVYLAFYREDEVPQEPQMPGVPNIYPETKPPHYDDW